MGKPDKDIVPPFITENIARSKKRKAMIDEIMKELGDCFTYVDPWTEGRLVVIMEKLQKFKDEL